MGYEEALRTENGEVRDERVRLWYVAATRARKILVLPRLPVAGSKSSWSAVVDLDTNSLPVIDLKDLPPLANPAGPLPSNEQTAELFAAEAAAVAGLQRKLTCLTPSRDGAASVVLADEPDMMRVEEDHPTPSVQGGRTRGSIIHKLPEECLTG